MLEDKIRTIATRYNYVISLPLMKSDIGVHRRELQKMYHPDKIGNDVASKDINVLLDDIEELIDDTKNLPVEPINVSVKLNPLIKLKGGNIRIKLEQGDVIIAIPPGNLTEELVTGGDSPINTIYINYDSSVKIPSAHGRVYFNVDNSITMTTISSQRLGMTNAQIKAFKLRETVLDAKVITPYGVKVLPIKQIVDGFAVFYNSGFIYSDFEGTKFSPLLLEIVRT